jgi:type I restriction enzyme, R subunit
MSRQAEAILEKDLIDQLKSQDYEVVTIHDEKALLSNLKTQLERYNKICFSDKEFAAVTNHLSKGNVFSKAKTLRDRFQFTRDGGERVYIGFFNSEKWNKSLFQVTNQITIEGVYKNRYDVTILINGIPLVQIELKRRGLELKEAFNQINRYHRHSFWANTALFQYIQIFVISNGVNTKYYANNKKQSFKQTFFWADVHNRNITDLSRFTASFLSQDHLGKMIAQYIVLNETYKILMVLRPYQYYATEAIIAHVQKRAGNGYIWHTTGSGKTLTSFKASQIIMDMPGVHKVVFVVDRKDLDYQTIKEFNSFRKGSVDGTDRTKVLIDQFLDRYVDKAGEAKHTKLIVTTIQKLNHAIQKQKYLGQIKGLKDKRMVFIFDECHRSQFGDTHKRITSFFNNYQMFGFTGTPIFADNAHKNILGKRTTRDLFGKRLHEYTLVNAIKDENVLKFKIEYIGRYRQSGNTIIDIDVEAIDTREVLNSPARLEKIVDYMIQYHDQKTHNRAYSALFAVSSIDNLITCYDLFKDRIKTGKTNLRVAGIFTYGVNEDSKDADGHIAGEDSFQYLKVAEKQIAYNTDDMAKSHTREKLDAMIADYNALYGTSCSTKDGRLFDNYSKDISKRLKEREKDSFQDRDRLDILLVVNMFLTGFDAKKVNTLYVDKHLNYHGLIQAFSRTNRIINETKSHGNILCFRNLKKATDEAIALFSNKDAKEKILLPDYEVIAQQFTKAFIQLLQIAPTVKSVNDLISEEDQLKFIQAFRELMRLKNILTSYSDFNWDDLPMNEQNFEDYKSKYLDIYDKVRSDNNVEKASILNDVDFELELILRDEINVAYILKLIAKLKGAKQQGHTRQYKAIMDLMAGDIELRSKRELIKKFIKENLPEIDADSIPEEFEKFWQEQKILALGKICEDEQLDQEQFKALIDAYIFNGQEPLKEDVIKCLAERPSILQARRIGEKILGKMKEYVQTFIRGLVA